MEERDFLIARVTARDGPRGLTFELKSRTVLPSRP
jgi:hypothetical protein